MQRREKKIETFIHINDTNFDKSIYNIIKQETDGCNMRVWGNITIYVGRIKREKCIESIAKVVTSDLDLLKKAYKVDGLEVYKQKNLSVQLFADKMNAFGTFLENGSDYPDWIGSPLVVHRRCVSPMYDISNKLSYDGIMKLQTASPKKELEEAKGAIGWVNDNIVNVAVTRAKYRLYVIGDKDAWKKSSCVSLLMEELEKYQHNYSNSIRTALTVTKSAPYALTGMETQKDGITFDCLVQSKQTY